MTSPNESTKDPVSSYYDAFSAHYDVPRGDGYHLFVDKLQEDIIAPYARGKDVLEVGCGTGLLLEKAARIANSAKGIDPSSGMLRHAERRGLNVQLGDARILPFANESFDLVYSFKVLAHVQPLQTALAEMSRVLRPGGILVIDFYNRHSLRYLARVVRGSAAIGQTDFTAATHREDDIPTEWKSPREAAESLPKELNLRESFGVRILGVLPQWYQGTAGRLFARLENRLAKPLARLGGFYVLVAQKK